MRHTGWYKTIAVSSLLALFTGVTWADPDVQAGLWESTIITKMDGMPMQPPPITSQKCITKEDLVPKKESPGESCSMEKPKISGNTVTWVVQCEQNGMRTSGVGEITYAGTSYHGAVNMEMKGGPMGDMKMIQTMTGKRIGDCK